MFQFGDIVCFRNAPHDDGLLMVIGKCRHDLIIEGPLIDIAPLEDLSQVDHKRPEYWQVCTHWNSQREPL